jgi:uncharacterized protein (DUF4415 family)
VSGTGVVIPSSIEKPLAARHVLLVVSGLAWKIDLEIMVFVVSENRGRGRPRNKYETEQVSVRLDRSIVEELRNNRRGLSKEIQERLARTIFEDKDEPHIRLLTGQIRQLAKDVSEALGAEWHADKKAHLTFVEAVKLVLADLPIPSAQVTSVKIDDPAATARVIYNIYTAVIRELEQHGRSNFRAPLRKLMEDKGNE